MKTSSIILTGFIAGVAGALAATLFAPDKGSKTRSKLAKTGNEYKEYILDNYKDLADSVTHPFEDLQDQTIRLSKKAINKAEKVKADAVERVNY